MDLPVKTGPPSLPPGCLEDNELLAFLDHGVSEGTRRAIEAHVDSCPDCRRLLAELARASEQESGERTVDQFEATSPGLPVSAPHATLELARGEVLAERFRIGSRLGEGGMGIVYAAEDLRLGGTIALKVLRHGAVGGPDAVAQLRREILLGRRVSHPNVCRVHDLGMSHGTLFITMEFVQGPNLASLLRRGRPTSDHSLAILLEVCQAIDAAHRQGVLHRDLKPANIMVSETGHVKVLDFGLACEARRDASQIGVRIGTPAYWSPEQARGENATERSDLYSIGRIGAEMLGGSARAGENDLEAVPPPLRGVLERCLCHDPRDRFQTAKELSLALQVARVSLARGERLSEGSARAARSPRRFRALAIALALVAVAATMAFAVATRTLLAGEPDLVRSPGVAKGTHQEVARTESTTQPAGRVPTPAATNEESSPPPPGLVPSADPPRPRGIRRSSQPDRPVDSTPEGLWFFE